jgi:hypothetical protein
MKTILKTTVALALVLTTTIGSAKNSEIGLTLSKVSKALILSLENPSKDFTVRISDKDDNVLYFERMEKSVVKKKFDLQGLQNGTYFFTTSDSTKTIVYTVAINGENIDILNKNETVKPYFRVAKERLFINFLNLDKSKINITVYDEEYRVVFSETVNEEMIIEKAFNFEGAFAGNYRVVVSDKNKSYTENFIVD